MTDRRPDSERFEALSRELLKSGMGVRFEARGASMSPAIRDGEIVYVTPVIVSKLRKDDIVLTKGHSGFQVHRLVLADPDKNLFITRGDGGQQDDPPLCGEQILGLAVAKEVRVGRNMVRVKLKGMSSLLWRGAARGQRVLTRFLSGPAALSIGASSSWTPSIKASTVQPRDAARPNRGILGLLFIVLAATIFAPTTGHAQVAVDATTSLANMAPGAGTYTGTFTHTTTNGANRMLIVSVSLNIANSPGTTITGATYNGTALTQWGFHNDAGNTRRVEMWYLLNPVSGTNLNVAVTVNVPAGGGSVGGAVAATTFTGVDQTVPLGAFVSADGAAGANSQLDVPSVVNGMMLDVLATGGDQTITIPSPQVSQWNLNSGGTLAQGSLSGSGSTRAGAPDLPISETFSGTSNWALGAVSINPTSADVAVSTSVGSAVFLGQASVYTITVSNNGPSAANGLTLTDTLATGPTFGSVVASGGTTCTGTGPINCTLPTPFASGATATITVTVTATTAGSYANTATITDSGAPPDPNTGNNSYTAVATVQSATCAAVALATAGTPAGVVNTYYPGSASVLAGAKSITVGKAAGAGTAIAVGDLLLVIQMQDATINTSNTVAYGNGNTGTGFTALNGAGNYEFVTATSAVTTNGGAVSISGAGTGGGLVFGYDATAATATEGQSTFQVIVVPQYSTAILPTTGLTAPAWNGATGGVLVMDASATLNLNGATVVMDGLGFRGGAGMQLTGSGGADTDYEQPSPATYTGATGGAAGWDASKGEGIAGTPRWVESSSTFLKTTTGVGYPSGTAGTDGSMARGAPGNAGAGGTDGDPNGTNDQNAGGGGGGNGGMGGFGGDSWNSNLSVGGEGGSVFPATINRVAMGGGGGAGTRNNSDGDNQASGGAAGGGIIIIRAYALTGTATFTANGAAAYNGTANDAGGGGGAGGSIVILSGNGGEGGLTLQANGGTGGDAWASQPYSLGDRHGPGGGGGGGVILVSGAPASITVGGGASGTTLTPGVIYGATAGAAGTSVTNGSITSTSGTQSGAECTPDMTLTKSHSGNFTRGSTASYTIPVSNLSAYGPSSGVVTMNDTLPVGLTPTSASGTGWTCSVSGQTASCVRSDTLAAGAAYPSITVNATVSQSAPATVTNVAQVSGGSETNLLNDTATNVASVVSSADLAVTDSASPDPVAAGSNITYSIGVTNNGPSAADNATVVMTIPSNTTLVSIASPTGWSCVSPGAGGTGNVICTNVNMAGSTASTFSLVVKVTAGTANGTVIAQTVSASSSANDPNSANNTASATTVVGTTAPNLTVTNVASPNPVQAGNNITYTQVVTNTGSTAATGATFTESTPGSTTFVSITPPAGWSCTAFPPQCTDASVAGGATGTFTVVYKVAAGTASGTQIGDLVTVNATNQSFGANSAAATDVVGTVTQADVVLTTAASPTSVLAGNDITYYQTISNNGPATATGLSFSETTPTNTTFQSVSAPAGWTCTAPAVGSTGNINCTAASLAVASEAAIIVVVSVPTTVTVTSSPISESASVTTTSSDPNSANNTNIMVSTPLGVNCDLAVTNSGTPSPVLAGGTITYTQVITNSGPSNCGNGTFSEPLPANTTFVSATVVNAGGGTWSCPNASPIACTSTSVPPGSTGTITAVYKVPAGTAAGTIITDTATVATTVNDTNKANNTATSTIAVPSGTQADLSVTNSASPNPVNAGSTITYTQTVTNNGPATANAPVLTETLPANTTAVSLSATGWTCVLGTLKCTDTTTMAANATTTFTYVVTVNSTVAAGTAIQQTDSVSSTTADPNSGNNSATATTYVADSAALSVTDSASPVPVQAGNNITYTQVVTNAGPSTATSASFSETTPANTTFQSLTSPTGWTCTTPAVNGTGAILCSDPSLATGAGTFTLAVKVNVGTAAGTAINDIVSVSSSTPDPSTANNSASAADVVAGATQADLVVTNAAAPGSVAAGSNVTYTQTVTNDGPAAATTGMTFSETTPPNTNFQSITPPAGWTCGTKPAVGGTGTITCTDGGSLAVGTTHTASFTLVLQVNAVTPSGTSITDTATATAGNVVPSLSTNTASATVLVANANSADMAVVKTATPNPVTDGTPLTYSLAVTNNGPASATDVTVTDTLPSVVTYLSSNTTQGSCSEAGGTVTCLLGTMANAGTATITILTVPNTPGVVTNTATVTADQTDPNVANDTSSQTETILAPTSINLQFLTAYSGTDKNGANRTMVMWKTSGETHNFGFNVYRELNGSRVRMNPSVIAGSALLMIGALPKHSGRSYEWIDPSAPVAGTSYWLEDIDVNGTRTIHGPVSVNGSSKPNSESSADETRDATRDATGDETRMVSQLNQSQPAAPGNQQSHVVETLPQLGTPTVSQTQKQFELAANPAVKIYVLHEGWHHVTQPELVQAGLDPNVDPAVLHLFAEAIEQPIRITGATAGPGGFGPQAAINFYGTGIDTVFSGTRVYWLVSGEGAGLRIPLLQPSTGSNQPPADFLTTVELEQHTTYFSALLTTNGENFFGAFVSPTPVDQILVTPHVDTGSTQTARLDLVLQGVITGFPHNVTVALNGTAVGEVTFTGQAKGTLNVPLPAGILQEGSNTVTLTAQNGDYDTSLVQSIRITYPHLYAADGDQLKFTGRAGDEIKVSGLASAPVVLDITDPNRPVQLSPQVKLLNGKDEIAVQVPWTTTNASAPVDHTLLAVAENRFFSAAAVRNNHPSHWHSPQPGADIAMVTWNEFAPALAPLVRAHRAEGRSSSVVFITDLYDEFNFGERSPFAIRQFLQSANTNWKTPPTYLLLNGRASLDPRDYLGLGHLDLVPTSIVPTSSLMTASDDWFSDFTGTGMPSIATGRLPVGTLDEAATVVGKIVAYEGKSTNGSWTSQALMVADKDDTESFTQDTQTVQAQLPATMQAIDVFRGTVGNTVAAADIISGINSGQLLVNYMGHGSEDQWAGADIFDANSVTSLTNGSQLPVFLIMDCLNGFFQDVYAQPLGVTLLLAPNGGAVAVLASSGLNQAPPQTNLDILVVENVFGTKRTLGESILRAKSHIGDRDVRETFTLLGDPAMQVKQPSAH